MAGTDFPSLVYVAGAVAVVTAGKPWLGRSWRRCADIGLLVLVVVLAIAGTAGVPELLLAVAVGVVAGAAVLVALGAPNRRPTPLAVVGRVRATAGSRSTSSTSTRADGGRSQLYAAALDGGDRAFVKVYARDSRDADLLYRGYRTALLRGPNDDWPSMTLEQDVEHEALLLLMAGRAEVACPALRGVDRAARRVDGPRGRVRRRAARWTS